MYNRNRVDFSELLGCTLVRITVGEEEIRFFTQDGKEYLQYHEQDCCEAVYVEDICGDLSDLLGEKILCAEERVSHNESGSDLWDDSQTWTFYELRTIKGSVTIRWLGQSNGYYSESVDFTQVK